ncbi:RHS repeat-associated core domain-containing protein [Agarilytica rhodophyticola]|uniref:RHS repeat-associated core domain-containing protein n=1 Tax=Agarilytica rhodophyticola TaxID=1737490 RepID=UPI000B344DAA|nr:RHS repeat-associated core domain-containing protein [Agarilytica rhodophyticola]
MQEVRYDSLGNIVFKTGVGDYSYGSDCVSTTHPDTYGPHALCHTSEDNAHYAYDANGNMFADGTGRNIHYTTFDKPDEITKDDTRITFRYAPDRSRYLRTDENTEGTTTTRYIGKVEKLTHPDGTQSIKRYLPGGALVTIKLDSAGSRVNQETQYLHKDHLGSLDVITNAMGTIAQDESGRDLVFSFDAWGQKRAALDWSTLMDNALSDFNTLVVTSPITRGFTMHEHLDAVGLIHMNGRIYDPRLGRFMQADPFVQAASNTQSYNRYSYVFNNPLNATDPSGYFSVGGFLGAVQTIVTAIAAIYCQACIPYISAAFGAVHAARAGGDLGDIARAAVSSYASASITSSYLADGFSWEGLLQVAVAGGITNVLNNGKFGHGFISAGVGTALGGKLAPVANETTNNILKGLGSIVLSGTISKATGGKFANGAGSAAFAWAVGAGVERLNKPEPAAFADKAAGDYTAEDVIDIIRSTKTGKAAFDSAKPEVVLDSKRGAYFNSKTNTLHLRANASLAVNVRSMAHELGHAYQTHLGINKPSAKKMSREDYINGMITNESMADHMRHQIYSELADPSMMAKPTGHDAWVGAKPAERMQLIKDRFRGPAAIYKTSTTGQTYGDYYGAYWDRVNQ